jgi:hypothetical protein
MHARVAVVAVVAALALVPASARADVPTRSSVDQLDAPDPHIVAAGDGTWRAYSTQVGSLNVPVRSSGDLVAWSAPWDAMPTLPGWASFGHTWAPGVIRWNDGTWRLYFASRHTASNRQCIGVASASTPNGPFTAGSQPLVCQLELGGSIDPYPYRDPAHGAIYLYWKSDENALGLASSQLWGMSLAGDGLSVVGTAFPLLARDQAWELPTIEQPAMISVGGRWWLAYSGNLWESGRYASGFASCAGPLGPCVKVTTTVPWMTSGGMTAGPGGLAFFIGADGGVRATWHAWAPGVVGYAAGGRRAMHIEPVTFDDGGPHLLSPGTAPFATPEAAVDAAYRDVLARGADPAGLQYWASRIRIGADTVAVTFDHLARSPEFSGIGEPVVRLYRGYFARLPDPAGLRYWMAVGTQHGLRAVSAAFSRSPEFVETYGELGNAAFVDRVYRNLLGRAADPQGQAYWTDRLARGMARGDLMLAFTESPENRAVTGADAAVVVLYVGMLQRAPEPAGLAYWSDLRRAGHPTVGLVAGILASSEYRVVHRLP